MNNILIIEDEERVSEVIKAYLEREGYNVHFGDKLFNFKYKYIRG